MQKASFYEEVGFKNEKTVLIFLPSFGLSKSN